MYGLLAGVIRMILDFSFPEPLCMEADQRPWLVRAAVYLVISSYLATLYISTYLHCCRCGLSTTCTSLRASS